ncbi:MULTISPECIES: SMC-Scp complex subunit ScpB [unclassified Rhizobium]|uniref:SMC-Scp complex subunit ScpB n=1 Tax=unclassified Rhizobium TaxID=2613769 RepID=UPI000EA8EF38|nr:MULTISPECIES: SMC-Scp complex subunit ScpB [unclassified Rhizobium]AYG68152.1 SMC-Scp complex subunit ScpB [Rhizobium sp. CCGE531]AYG74543.1 SMC-Scp complex subunit ScpB [Rhizobium sp. CCGE532]
MELEAETLQIDERRLSEAERIAEALVFASAQPVSEAFIAERVAQGVDIPAVMRKLKADYAMRGVNLVQIDGAWAFRTAADLSFVIRRDESEVRKLSRAALEVLAIIAYHQPVTRAEIEDIRGVQTSRGTLDVLMEAGWVRFRGRRRTPGRPVTLGTTRDFLDHFGLEELRDLPGLEELKGAGLLSGRIPANFNIPSPLMNDELTEDEDPITQMDLEELGILPPSGESSGD